MQFPIPNSAGHREIDEANTSSTHGYTQRGCKKKRRVREFNTCHSPADGTFCSKRAAANRWRRTTQRRPHAEERAARLQRRLDTQVQQAGGNVGRITTLRKRMDVTGPLVKHRRQTSFLGTAKRILFGRDPRYKGRKR